MSLRVEAGRQFDSSLHAQFPIIDGNHEVCVAPEPHSTEFGKIVSLIYSRLNTYCVLVRSLKTLPYFPSRIFFLPQSSGPPPSPPEYSVHFWRVVIFTFSFRYCSRNFGLSEMHAWLVSSNGVRWLAIVTPREVREEEKRERDLQQKRGRSLGISEHAPHLHVPILFQTLFWKIELARAASRSFSSLSSKLLYTFLISSSFGSALSRSYNLFILRDEDLRDFLFIPGTKLQGK